MKTILPWIECNSPHSKPSWGNGRTYYEICIEGIGWWFRAGVHRVAVTTTLRRDPAADDITMAFYDKLRLDTGMIILTGIKTYQPNARFDSSEFWLRIFNHPLYKQEREIILENETALYKFHSGEESLIMSPLRTLFEVHAKNISWVLPTVLHPRYKDESHVHNRTLKTEHLVTEIADIARNGSRWVCSYAGNWDYRTHGTRYYREEWRNQMRMLVGDVHIDEMLYVQPDGEILYFNSDKTVRVRRRIYTPAEAIPIIEHLPGSPVYIYPSAEQWVATAKEWANGR